MTFLRFLPSLPSFSPSLKMLMLCLPLPLVHCISVHKTTHSKPWHRLQMEKSPGPNVVADWPGCTLRHVWLSWTGVGGGEGGSRYAGWGFDFYLQVMHQKLLYKVTKITNSGNLAVSVMSLLFCSFCFCFYWNSSVVFPGLRLSLASLCSNVCHSSCLRSQCCD